MSYAIHNAYRTTPPPPPPVMYRVHCHKKRGAPLELFEAVGPIGAAIRQVRDAGYQRALICITTPERPLLLEHSPRRA